MNGSGVDVDLIGWTANCLSDQTVEMVIERIVLERGPVEAGIPQHSPVSPILFSTLTSGLISQVQDTICAIDGLTFVDDVRWMATGSDVSQIGR